MDPLLAPQPDPLPDSTSPDASPPPTAEPEHLLLLNPLQHDYYGALPYHIASKFRNLDHDDVFDVCEKALKSRITKNFIVDFGGAKEEGGEAWCALDFEDEDADGIRALLEKRRDNVDFLNIRTRWINIFQPYEQKKLVSAITSHYNFSPRLTSVITTAPTLPQPATPPAPLPQRPASIRGRIRQGIKYHVYAGVKDTESGSSAATTGRASMNLQVPRVEQDVELQPMDVAGVRGRQSIADKRPKDPNYMDLAQTLWHWHAVEWGNQYICTGFNHLHSVPTAQEYLSKPDNQSPYPQDPAQQAPSSRHHHSNNPFSRHSPDYRDDSSTDTESSENDEDDPDPLSSTSHFDPKTEMHPYGRRIWSWLVLCDDGTVISIHEPLTAISDRDLIKVRMNMLTVFRSLSCSQLAARNTAANMGAGLDDLPFRAPNTESDTVDGGPSLLFYYLFDDWYSTFRFVYERGAPYSTKMSALRNSMRRDPHLKHLKKLHRITRRLASLKRMMETRKIILENILYRQEKPGDASAGGVGGMMVNHSSHPPPAPTMQNSIESLAMLNPLHHHQIPQAPHHHNPPRVLTSMGSPFILGVRLSPLSITKFERLRDRIRLYVLGELDSLLVEKSELENLTFNLISLKQSATVEVLTRVTIWLTKFTFLFLPLTLVTGYFSMQLKDFEGKYPEKVFWIAAAISVVLTMAVLWVVGRQAGTEGMEAIWRGVRDVWSSRRRGKGRKRR